MKRSFVLLVCGVCIFSLPLAGYAKEEKATAPAKANQALLQQVAKSGVRGQQLRDLGAAIKQDDTLRPAVQGALEQGLRGRELADLIQKELKSRQDKAAAAKATEDASAVQAGIMGKGQARGRGNGGQAMGMQGMGGQGMRQGMGSGQGMQGMGNGAKAGSCPAGMNSGQKMGQGMGGRAPGMQPGRGGARGGR